MRSLAEFLKRKCREFKELDEETRFQFLRRNAGYLAKMVLGYLAIITLKMLYPVCKIRVGVLFYDRVGHLAINTELYLRQQAKRKSFGREWHLFFIGKPANRKLLKMIRRQLHVIESPLVSQILRPLSPKGSNILIDLAFEDSELDEFNGGSPKLDFTKEEIAQGRKLLSRMGIGEDKRYICFHARDSAYLNAALPRSSWAYHDYRDCDIDNYLPAAEYLTSIGYFAVRTGNMVDKRLVAPKNGKIIDYASEFSSEFGDIYLPSHCNFFLGNTSGLAALAICFTVPVAMANVVPLTEVPFGGNLNVSSLYIPKKLWNIKDKRFLSFREMLVRTGDKWSRSENYTDAGIQVVENTAEEILALAREMHERLEGHWVATKEDEELQARYQELLTPSISRAYNNRHHRAHRSRARMGAEFLRQNMGLLD